MAGDQGKDEEKPGPPWWLVLGGVVIFAILSLVGAIILVIILSLGYFLSLG